MSKYYTPINLHSYTITTPGITQEQVSKGLLTMMEWLKDEQNLYYKTQLDGLTQKLVGDGIRLNGSLNSLGRKLGIEPANKADYQPYNMSEMFRASVLSKTSYHLQNETLLTTITSMGDPSELGAREVLAEYKRTYPSLKLPKYELVKRTLTRLQNGVLHNVPKGDGVLPLWAGDGHYCSLTRDKNDLYLTLPISGVGRVTLRFKLPKSDRFKGDKVTRPNVYLDKKNRIKFGFTVQKPFPNPKPHESVMGVDLGRVEPFTSTIYWGEHYSSPIHPSHKVNSVKNRITHLLKHSKSLYAKEMLNEKKGHLDKAGVLRVERLRLRSKISRLKIEQSHYVANQIVQVAESYNALIVLENLSWVPHSKWDQARTQEHITHKAKTKGHKTRTINPKHTSQTCPRCEGKVTHSGRATHCLRCLRVLNRDILASRNIAGKAYSLAFNQLTQLSLPTRVMRPVTTGSKVSYPTTRNTT